MSPNYKMQDAWGHVIQFSDAEDEENMWLDIWDAEHMKQDEHTTPADSKAWDNWASTADK